MIIYTVIYKVYRLSFFFFHLQTLPSIDNTNWKSKKVFFFLLTFKISKIENIKLMQVKKKKNTQKNVISIYDDNAFYINFSSFHFNSTFFFLCCFLHDLFDSGRHCCFWLLLLLLSATVFQTPKKIIFGSISKCSLLIASRHNDTTFLAGSPT